MSADRYVVLGLAHVRSTWFAQVSQWATSAALPIDFIKCVSIDEARARLASGRPFSALVIDAGVTGADRDLFDQAEQVGCRALVVDDGSLRQEWAELGVAAVLPADFDQDQFRSVLIHHAQPIDTVTTTARLAPADPQPQPMWKGRLLAVTGAGGTGSSTVAMALARGLGRDARNRALVVLADLCLDADHAMLHDARDIVPGIQELVDAFRYGSPGPEDVRALTFGDGDPYRLLLGLRRHRDWTVLRSRSFQAALDGLRTTFTQVVADIDPDVEGEGECGSVDVEERNLMARTVVRQADIVAVTGLAGPQGLHRLARVLSDLREVGVPDRRILPIVNRAPRSPRLRSEMARTIADLVAVRSRPDASSLASPLFLGENRRIDAALRDGLGAPASLATTVAAAVSGFADRLVHDDLRGSGAADPEPVRPGSLGAWGTSQEAAG